MLRVWRSPELRPTMDIDMLGRTSNEEADIVAQIQDILTVDVETDGLAFDPDSIQAERITEDADYEGIRIRFLCALGTARINMQIDSPVAWFTGWGVNFLSRQREYQADRYAQNSGFGRALADALVRLSKNNLSNLTPHPAYVSVYYSHPPLLSRWENLKQSHAKQINK